MNIKDGDFALVCGFTLVSIRGNVEEPIPQSLTRQNSLYSLKLHEVQTHLGSSGKPLGSMNLDELVKTVLSPAEEGLVRQGSLTLPRDLSKKIVDEVWRDIQQDKNGNSTTTHKQPTLGEITLEDLLLRAGVVTETIVPQENVVNIASNGQWVEYHQPGQQQGFIPYPVCDMQEMVMMGGLSDTPQAPGRKRVAGEIVEKTVERRQKRMIKNRESAARSRASKPYFAVVEYWDSLSYTYGELDYNQDAHRQRIVDWMNATSGAAGAFDVTTKGILHAVLMHIVKGLLTGLM